MEKVIKNTIQKIKRGDLAYPLILSQISNPPQNLYVIGNKELLREDCVSIVGCRDCSDYGSRVARQLAFLYTRKSKIIVSGLALGIDTSAHIGTIDAGGRTVAVLASGLDIIYPNSNIELARKIIMSGGAIISEYENGTPPLKENFVARNRIISGLSSSIIVVEAKMHSGSLITANYAVEQGRNVLAVPGNIFSKNSEGTNELIRQGAEPITKII